MKLVFTDEAKADLLQIGEWIAEDNPARALTFVDELETRCARLTTMPRAYPLVRGQENSGVRRVRHGNYLIFYRVTADVVEILHVLHGARDYEPIVFPDTAKK
jgi:addiction module RelE/StbE family toxin